MSGETSGPAPAEATQAPQEITGEINDGVQHFRNGENGEYMSRQQVAEVWQNQLTTANAERVVAEREAILETVGKLTEQYPDRPDLILKGSGLSNAKLQKLGYTRLSELQALATPFYKAKQAETAKQERRAAADAKHAEYTAELDAYREVKNAEKAENARIDAVAGLTLTSVNKMTVSELASLTGLSQKEIHMKGKNYVLEIAKDARVKQQERLAKEANDNKLVVPRNEAEEARQSALGNALRDHDRAVLRAQANKGNKSTSGTFTAPNPDTMVKNTFDKPPVTPRVDQAAPLFGAPNPADMVKNTFDKAPVTPRVDQIAPKLAGAEKMQDLFKQLYDARKKYVELNVGRRKAFFGPRIKEAKAEYDQVRNEILKLEAAELEKAGKSKEEIEATNKAKFMHETAQLGNLTNEMQEAHAGNRKFNRFYDWWARQGGRTDAGKRNWMGMAKKFGVTMAIVAAPSAAAVAAVGAAVGAGSILTLGTALGSSIARNLFTSKVEKGANAKTVSKQQTEFLLKQAGLVDPGTTLKSEDVSDMYQAQTDKIHLRNIRRTVGTVALGAATVFGGKLVASEIGNHIKGRSSGVKATRSMQTRPTGPKPPVTTGPKQGPPAPKPQTPNVSPSPVNPAESGRVFEVVKGGGIYQQLEKGLGLSPADARKASALLDKNGYFNGDKILGIGHTKAGKIIPYLRGAGDSKFHIPSDAIDLLKQNGILVN